MGPKSEYVILNVASCEQELNAQWRAVLGAAPDPTAPPPLQPREVTREHRERVMERIQAAMEVLDTDTFNGELLELLQAECPEVLVVEDGESAIEFERMTNYNALKKVEEFVAAKLKEHDPKRRKVS